MGLLGAVVYLTGILVRIAGLVALCVAIIAGWAVCCLARASIPVPRPLRALKLPPTTIATWHDNIDPAVASRLSQLLILVRRYYILPWYSKISDSPALPDAVESIIRQVLLNIQRSEVDWPDLLVSRVVPLVKAHLHHFQRVQHLAGPLPLPSNPHTAFVDSSPEAHICEIVERVVQSLLPDKDRTVVVGTLVREIGLSVIIPVFELLADADFWNRQIDERGARYQHER